MVLMPGWWLVYTIGIMGSYPGEASNYGPARAFAAGETTPGTTSGAQISFSPSVTYSLAQGSCVPNMQGECPCPKLLTSRLSSSLTGCPKSPRKQSMSVLAGSRCC